MAKLSENHSPSKKIDWSKPYAELIGLPGASFEQDGIKFKANGMESDSVAPFVEEIIEEDNSELPYICCIPQETPSIEEKAIEESGRDLESMHWRHLKALVECYGGEYEDKERAMEFLKGKA